VSEIALGFSEVLAALFLLAAVGKLWHLSSGADPDHPLVTRTRWRRRRRRALLAAAGAIEIAVTVLLVYRPVAGVAVAGLLLGLYLRELTTLDRRETCACFGSLSATPVRVAAVRNLVLMAGCVASGAVLLAEPDTTPTAGSLGAAAIVLSALAASWVLSLSLRRTTESEEVAR
jgi:hypothetical protein